MNHSPISESFVEMRLICYPKVVLDRLVLEEISFQIVTEGIYKKCVAPKRKFWPKFPITIRSLSIPFSTWESNLNDHIVSLKLGFASKMQHDPKGIVDFHLTQNYFKTGYTHEETPYDFIYQGVDTFFEVLAMDKRKEEQSHILQYQKEISNRVRQYRSIELDIQEKVIKYRE